MLVGDFDPRQNYFKNDSCNGVTGAQTRWKWDVYKVLAVCFQYIKQSNPSTLMEAGYRCCSCCMSAFRGAFFPPHENTRSMVISAPDSLAILVECYAASGNNLSLISCQTHEAMGSTG